MYEHLIVKEQGRWVEVHLNRPQVRHALSRALMREITAVARDLSDRTDIDVVILTGDARCFSAGADLNDAQAWADDSLSTVQRRDIAGTGFRMCKAWEEMPQITIAAIEGYAVGGGLALSLACDWRETPLCPCPKSPWAYRSPGAPSPVWSTCWARPKPSA